MTTQWSARVDLAVGLTDEQADDLAADLAGHGAAIVVRAGDPASSSVQLGVDTDTVMVAVQEALSAVLGAAPPGVRVVGVEVVTDLELDRRLVRPAPLELITSEEVADILGVTRQRVDAMAETLEDFPVPAAVIGRRRRKGWWRPAIERYAVYRRQHHPGRIPGTRTPRADPPPGGSGKRDDDAR